MRHSLLGWLLLSLLAAFVPSASEATVPIPAGFDLLETDSSATYQDRTLPPGALLPFCDAGFSGRVFLRGEPFDCYQGLCDLHPTDTIVQRLAVANPLLATIPIEIVRFDPWGNPCPRDCPGPAKVAAPTSKPIVLSTSLEKGVRK